MIEIGFSPSYKRALRRRVGEDKALRKKLISKIALFQVNPFDPQLRTHKLSGRLSDIWSFSVDYDLRVLFYFESDQKVVCIDIGGHDEVY